MNLPFFIAGRYLFARKSHNVINIISAISSAGMAIGTAALIIILSIYNGFDNIVRDLMSNVEPDLLITPETGKVFVPEGDIYDSLYAMDEVSSMCCILEERVFINYDGKQAVAKAKGVDRIYEEESPIAGHIIRGEFSLHRGDVPLAVTGAGLARKLGINPAFLSPLDIYFPSRTGRISIANPAASVESVRLYPSGVFSINNDIDNDLIIVPIEKMRELLEYGDEVSAVEIRLKQGTTEAETRHIRETVSASLGEDFRVSDRFMQNESLYRMMKYEKIIIFMILTFIIIIIACNIFGSLTMLMIEKRDDIVTLRSMGADDGIIRKIFVLEGWMISLAGMLAGLAAGIGFALLQQRFGFIRMPGNFVVQAYPIILSWKDILLTSAGVGATGYLIALMTASAIRKSGNGTSFTENE